MPTIADLIEPFARERRGRGKRPAGVQRYCDCLKRIDRYLVARGLGELDQLDDLVVSDYRDHCIEDRGNTPATVAKHLSALRAFAAWATKRGHMTGDPTAEVAWPVVRRPAPKPVAPAELDRLTEILEAEPDGETARWYHRRNRLAIELMYYAGLRLGEVSRLRVADVNLTTATVTIRDSKSQDRSVALHADLVEALAVAVAGKRQSDYVVATATGAQLKPKIVAKIFSVWLQRQGLKISAHRLRHSFGTELLRASGNLGVVQRAMGHASPETTMGYAQIVVEDQRDAVARLPRLGGRRAATDEVRTHGASV